ncbi:MAG: fibronectin type III domain-containing protein, partial [Candidatus Marinimicrobia bacterium]|nr:fibronectin type III domain-containing protein [Candidatus Neomarinimicrobiota bacterium]
SPVDSVNSSTTSYTDTGLSNGTPYYYGVKAKNSAGEYSAMTNEESATPSYSGPENITTANSNTRITLNWDALSAGTLYGYYIYRGTSTNPTTLLDSLIAGNPINSYFLDDGLESGITYYYRLRAEFTDGSVSSYSESYAVTPDQYAMTVDGSIDDWSSVRQIHNDPVGDVGYADIDSLKLNADGFYLYGALVTASNLDGNLVDVFFDTDFNTATGESVNGIGADYKLTISPWGSNEFLFRNQFNSWESDNEADFNVVNANNNQFHEFSIHLDHLDSPDSLRFSLRSSSTDNAPDTGYLAYQLDPNDAVREFTAANGDTKVNLNWEAKDASGLAGYFIYRGTATDPTTEIASITSGTPLNSYYLDTELVNETTYYYRIRAKYSEDSYSDYTESIAVVPDWYTINVDGNITDWSDISVLYSDEIGGSGNADIDSIKIFVDDYYLYGTVVTTNPLEYDAVLVFLDVDFNTGTGQITNGIGAEYKLRISPFSSNEFHSYSGSWNTEWSADFNIINANNNRFHEFKISLDDLDNPSQIRLYYSTDTGDQAPEDGYLAINTTKVAPNAPSELTALADSAKVTLRWNANDPAKLHKYRIYRSNDPLVDIDNSNNLIDSLEATASPPDTSYVNSGLTNDQVYYYVVTAVDSTDRASNESQEIMATPNSYHEQLVELLHTNTSYAPNNEQGYPFNTDWSEVKHQSLYLAEDFANVGIPQGAWFSALELKPSSVSAEIKDFRLALGAKAANVTELFGFESYNQDSVVFGPETFNQSDFTADEWKRFNIDPFHWNSSSNLILEATQDLDWSVGGLGGVHVRQVDGTRARRGANDGMSYPFGGMSWESPEDKVLALRVVYSSIEPVGNFTTTAGHKQIALSWVAPQSGTVTEYIIYSGTSSGAMVPVASLSNTDTDYTITGLTNGYSYYVGVQAKSNTDEYSSISQAQAIPNWTGPKWYVDADSLNGSGPFEGSPENPFIKIQSAIDAANSETDTVYLKPGIYSGFGNYNLDLGTKNLIIESEKDSDSTFVDSDGSNRHFTFSTNVTADTKISGFTFRNGASSSGDGMGGSVLISGGSPQFSNCVFYNNEARQGGAIAVDWNGGAPSFTGCRFVGNTARNTSDNDAYGGAVWVAGFDNSSGPVVEFNRCIFNGNQVEARYGAKGGALAIQSRIDLVNCLIVNNKVTAGYPNYNGETANGGGLFVDIDTDGYLVRIINTTIANDTVAVGGGSNAYGGGVFLDGWPATQQVTMFNSIIWDNYSPQSGSENIVDDGGANVVAGYNIMQNSDHFGWYYDKPGNQSINPQFVDATAGNYTLSNYSPAIGAGVESFQTYSAPIVDITGTTTRPDGAGGIYPDLGAYENPLDVSPYPDSPTNLSAEELHRAVRLSWDSVDATDVAYYIVYQAIEPDSTTFDSIAIVLPGLSTFVDTVANLTNMTKYYFGIGAVDSSGYKSIMSDDIVAVPHYQGPVWVVDVDVVSGVFEEGSSESPYSNIRQAVWGASQNDTILIKPGIYSAVENYYINFNHIDQFGNPVGYTRNLVLLGEYGPDSTIIDLQSNQFLDMNSGESYDSKLIGLNIKNGQSTSGIIHIDNSSLEILNCVLDNNSNFNNVEGGGAIQIRQGGNLHIDQSLFQNNTSSHMGGAISVMDNFVNLDIKNTIFINNYGSSGGGAIGSNSNSSSIQIIHSLFTDNSSGSFGNGGALSNLSGSGQFNAINSIFWDNRDWQANMNDIDGTIFLNQCISIDGGIQADPLLETDDAGNLSLSDYSPAIGLGVLQYSDIWSGMTQVPVYDFYGNDRPNPTASSPDLGPIENDRYEPLEWVYYVATDEDGGSDSNDGKSTQTAFLTIQHAIDNADDLDTVEVLAGTYTSTGNNDLNFFGKDIVLRSSDGPDLTILDLEDNIYAFDFYSSEPSSARIIGFTVQNGNFGNGGAVHLQNASPRFFNMKFVNCNASISGGAIFAQNSSSRFYNCIFAENNSAGEA